MGGIIYIEYLNGTTEERQVKGDYWQALEEQRKLLRNKQFMQQVKVLKVVAVDF